MDQPAGWIAIGQAVQGRPDLGNRSGGFITDGVDYLVVLALLGLLRRIARMRLGDIALDALQSLLQFSQLCLQLLALVSPYLIVLLFGQL